MILDSLVPRRDRGPGRRCDLRLGMIPGYISGRIPGTISGRFRSDHGLRIRRCCGLRWTCDGYAGLDRQKNCKLRIAAPWRQRERYEPGFQMLGVPGGFTWVPIDLLHEADGVCTRIDQPDRNGSSSRSDTTGAVRAPPSCSGRCGHSSPARRQVPSREGCPGRVRSRHT